MHLFHIWVKQWQQWQQKREKTVTEQIMRHGNIAAYLIYIVVSFNALFVNVVCNLYIDYLKIVCVF